MKTLCSMSFSDSPLRFVHMVLWIWGVIYVIICSPRHAQVQEDFCCNEDALFNVFFWLSFAVCSHGVMNLRGKLRYYYEPLAALADLKVSNSFILLRHSKINENQAEICTPVTRCSVQCLFYLPLANRSHSVINCRGNLCYYYVSVTVLVAPNLLLRWMDSPHWCVVATQTYIHTQTYVHKQTYIHTNTHIHTQTYIYTQTHTNIHTYTKTHM